MKKSVLLASLLLTWIPIAGTMAADMDPIEAKCKQWAKEDEVSPKELDAYVKDSIAQTKGDEEGTNNMPQGDDSSAGDAASKSE